MRAAQAELRDPQQAWFWLDGVTQCDSVFDNLVERASRERTDSGTSLKRSHKISQRSTSVGVGEFLCSSVLLCGFSLSAMSFEQRATGLLAARGSSL